MRAVVVYDSSFGSTERIAHAIARGVEAAGGSVRVAAAAAAPGGLDAADLLFVGGPTQRHRMSPALAAWLATLPRGGLRGVAAASFDTRYRMARWLTGSSAKGARRALDRAGCRLVAPAESFFVEKDVPPTGEKRRHSLEKLEPGELGRAEAWGSAVAATIAALR